MKFCLCHENDKSLMIDEILQKSYLETRRSLSFNEASVVRIQGIISLDDLEQDLFTGGA